MLCVWQDDNTWSMYSSLQSVMMHVRVLREMMICWSDYWMAVKRQRQMRYKHLQFDVFMFMWACFLSEKDNSIKSKYWTLTFSGVHTYRKKFRWQDRDERKTTGCILCVCHSSVPNKSSEKPWSEHTPHSRSTAIWHQNRLECFAHN